MANNAKENIEYKYPKSIEDRRKDRAGNLLDDKNSGGKILKFSNILGGSKNSASSTINNSVLWQATIQTVADGENHHSTNRPSYSHSCQLLSVCHIPSNHSVYESQEESEYTRNRIRECQSQIFLTNVAL